MNATLKRYRKSRVRTTIQSSDSSMRPAPMFNIQCRALLIAALSSSCLLMGCESNLERFYRQAATPEGAPPVTVQPRATSPRLVYSHDPDGDSRLLRQNGYVLMGTTSFNSSPDLTYADRMMVAQGQKVGAAIVLLKAPSYFATLASCYCEGGATYFASYWAKSDPAGTPEPQ
jgi:hypothetical protein